MAKLTNDRLCEGFRAETARFAEVLRDVDLETPSPTCPGWTAGQLAAHVRQALDWGSTIVETRAGEFVSPAATSSAGGGGAEAEPGEDWTAQVGSLAQQSLGALADPEDRGQLVSWLVAGADRLASALRTTGFETPVWSGFSGEPAGIWARWAILETSVHRADAQILAGRTERLEHDLSLDSVDLWLSAVRQPAAATFFDPRLANLKGNGERLRFQATDATGGPEEGWLAVRTPEGLATSRWTDGESADVVVKAEAGDLLLLLKRRLPVTSERVEVTGDRRLIQHWWENVLT